MTAAAVRSVITAIAGLRAFAARIEGGIVPSAAHPARENREALRKPVTAPLPSLILGRRHAVNQRRTTRGLSLRSLARECVPQAAASYPEGTADQRADQQYGEIAGRECAVTCHVTETRVNDG